MIEAFRGWQWILPLFLFACFSLHFLGVGELFLKSCSLFLDREPTIGKLLHCWWWRQLRCSQWIPPSRLGCFGRLLPARLAGSRIWEKNLKLNTRLWSSIVIPVGHTDIRYVGSGYVVWGNTLGSVVWPEPMLKLEDFLWFPSFVPPNLFHIMAEATHEDGVPCKLTEVAAGELEDLGRDAVLLHQRLLQQRHQIFWSL